MASDSIARDQLRSFIERIERLDTRTPADLASAIEDRDARHRHCLERLVDFDRRAPLTIDRARIAAASLLGCDTDTVIHRAAMWRRHGGFAEAINSLSWMPAPVWPVPSLDHSLVGYVYGLASENFRGVVKVGFSADPERRRHQLQYQHGIKLKLIIAVPGTRVDESMVHFAMRGHGLANEWFDLRGEWRNAFPLASVMTPDRMWREMLEAA